MKFIISKDSITFFLNNRPRTVNKGTVQYAQALEAFDLPEDEQEAAVAAVFAGNVNDRKEMEAEGFEFVGQEVKIDGQFLPKVLSDMIASLKKEGLPISLFLPFWRNLKQNPDYAVVHERGFYDFLQYRQLPLTEDGCFIAYRGVRGDYYSKSGNTRTTVLQGKVDWAGCIYNGIGEVIEVARNGVTTDRSVHCAAHSLHIGSLDYAKNWGNKVVVVKVNPKDVVSVASDYECQKLRVCKFEVIADFEEEIQAPATDKKGKAVSHESIAKLDAFGQRISKYLDKKRENGTKLVSVQQIRNSFSPNYPDKKRVLATVSSLGYVWYIIDGKEYVSL